MFGDGTLPDDLPGPHAGRPVVTAGAPRGGARAAVVALHGRGATAQGVLNLLDPLARHGVAFVAPAAERGRWYPYAGDEPRERNEPHLASAVAVVDRVLAETRETLSLPPEAVFLVGFSQGASVAAEHAADRGGAHPIAVLSGGLLGPSVGAETRTGDLTGTPTLVAGGADDDRVPPERVHATAAALRELGADVTERVYDGVGHEVTADEFAWLNDRLAAVVDG
ncbi:alpha/beta hydrolase [Halobaculum litoreum]|uniref:Alpha/beta hydrolase n=1 Tax=Halobaculum litoreum TaxID=3031998 RepID=A0ABD5XMA2_9EURY|nr:dienelactone hydrolase family protein [Halobaculum sp. DT92]